MVLGDFVGGIASGGSARLFGTGVEGVADEVAAGGLKGFLREICGVAGEKGRKCCVDAYAGFAEFADDFEAMFEGGAVGFVKSAHGVVVGGEGEADAGVECFELREISEDEGSSGLDDDGCGWVCYQCVEQARHHLLVLFGGLVGVDERGAVDDLLGF